MKKNRCYISRYDITSMTAYLSPAEIADYRDRGFTVTILR